MRRLAAAILLMALLWEGNGCALIPSHQFALPGHDWTTRSGQLAYYGKRRTIIGEVLARYSAGGDFELTFTKGPGLTLLLIRTDPKFARLEGALVGIPWSGPLADAPARVRGWLKLREEILRSPSQQSIGVTEANEKFVLRF